MKNTLILNRDFQVPTDGWYQLAPIGEFPHEAAGIVQIIDREACDAMAAMFAAEAAKDSFAGVLIDFDHFSLDAGQKSEAAGWITALESRDNPSTGSGQAGLWAKIRWSDIGEEAVKGGRYRFLSPVWARADCVDLGAVSEMSPSTGSGSNGSGKPFQRVRPIRLLNAAVTNDPNLKGILPLSNRRNTDDGKRNGSESVDFRTSVETGSNRESGDKVMKAVVEKLVNHLGLAADASEVAVLAAMKELPSVATHTALQNSLRELQTKHDALVADVGKLEEDLVNRDLSEFEGVITEGTKGFWKEQLLGNRAGALVVLGELKTGKETPVVTDQGGRKPLHNRSTAKPEQPGAKAAEKSGNAVRIRNRAHEIAKAEGVPFSVAFRRASREADEAKQ